MSSARPKSDLLPGQTFQHTFLSLALKTGFNEIGSGRFWPYSGLGAAFISAPKIDSTTHEVRTVKAGALYASLGFLHRPLAGFIWGMEGRYLFVFSKPDMRETQASILAGYSWGGRATPPREAPTPTMSNLRPPAAAAVAAPLDRPSDPRRPERSAAMEPGVQSTPRPAPPPALAPTPATVPAPVPVRPAPAPVPTAVPVPVPGPVGPAPSQPPPPPAPVVLSPAPGGSLPPIGQTDADARKAARLEALRRGDLARALELGKQHLASLAPDHWTVRLEVATQPATLKRAVEAFREGSPDLFILPLMLKDGKTGGQVIWGDYPSKAEAEQAAKRVPGIFLTGGQRALVLPVGGLLAATMPSPLPVRAGAAADPCCPDDDSAPAVVLPEGIDPERASRLKAMLLCNMPLAVELGRKHADSLPRDRWTIRLEVAVYPCTLKRAVAAFPSRKPDLFLAPYQLPSGRKAYQLFLGDYASKAEAERAGKAIPPLFLEDDEIPIPYKVQRIPSH